MAKKPIDVIREHFGLELYEEFKARGNGDTLWRFTEKSLQFYDSHFQDDWVDVKPEVVGQLILDEIEVVKLPFTPKLNEYYWSYDKAWHVNQYIYLPNSYADLLRIKNGHVFRTYRDADLARPRIYHDMTGGNFEQDCKSKW